MIHFNTDFHYKPSILGYPYFRKHPYTIPETNSQLTPANGWLEKYESPFWGPTYCSGAFAVSSREGIYTFNESFSSMDIFEFWIFWMLVMFDMIIYDSFLWDLSRWIFVGEFTLKTLFCIKESFLWDLLDPSIAI